MKKLRNLIVLIFIYNSINAQTWVPLTSPATLTLNSVFFLNKDTGFIGGGIGTTGVMYKTIDGGSTWASITVPYQIYRICFLTKDTGYIFTSNGSLYTTSNGGNTWSFMKNFPSSYGVQMFLQNSSVGFVRRDNYIWRTINGGTSWDSTNIVSTSIPNFVWYEISFISPSVGYTSNMPNYIWKTTNQGNSWSLNSTVSANPQLFDFNFLNSNIGIALSGNMSVFPYKTTNGGTSWSAITFTGTIDAAPQPKITFTSNNKVFILSSGHIYSSNDTGNSWSPMTISPSTINFRDWFMVNDSIGYAVGNIGTVYKTYPGAVTPPTTAASTFFIGNITNTSMQLNWSSGNGSSRIVVACANSNTLINPSFSVSYSASNTFGSGSQIGSGNYVVYNGTGNSCTVSGLSLNTAYYYRVYEYNGTGTNANYLTSSFATAGAMTLPVKLISFIAEKNNNEVNLNWQTASELNNDYFEVERTVGYWPLAVGQGLNANCKWEVIGKVEGHGSTSVINDYHFTDDISNIQPPISNIYYRLKQFDFNGQYEYSKVISVSMEKNNSNDIMIYPNPTTNLLNIETGSNTIYSAEIFDVTGRSVSEKVSFNNNLTINIQQLSKGIYFLRCTSENSQISKMLVVK